MDLETDKRLWLDIGEAIAILANVIASRCAESPFCHERPAASALCSRLAESIDDQLDGTGWTVIEAAARAALVQ